MAEEKENESTPSTSLDIESSGIYRELQMMKQADEVVISGDINITIDNDNSHEDRGLFDGIGGFFSNIFKNPLAGILTGSGLIAVVVVVLLLVRRRK